MASSVNGGATSLFSVFCGSSFARLTPADHGSGSDSPPLRLPAAVQASGLTVSTTNRTDPSHSQTLTPWVW